MRLCTIMLAVALLMSSTAACSSRPAVSGEIRDNFGGPVSGATVSVSGTTFRAQTDQDGKYTVQYVPGAVRLDVSKDGYLAETLTLNVAIATQVPASPVVLYRQPPARGVYFVGPRDYVPIGRVRLRARQQDLGFRGWDQPSSAVYYYLDGVEHKSLTHLPPPDRNKSNRFVFVDSETAKLRLFRVPWDGYTVLSREFGMTMSRDEATVLKEEPSVKKGGFLVRSATLDPGWLYAFVATGAGAEFCDIGCGSTPFGSPLAEPVYAFDLEGGSEPARRGGITNNKQRGFRSRDGARPRPMTWPAAEAPR